jgi:hypothetical protein
MEAWRGSAAGALVVVADGGVGKSAFAVWPGGNCSKSRNVIRDMMNHIFLN